MRAGVEGSKKLSLPRWPYPQGRRVAAGWFSFEQVKASLEGAVFDALSIDIL